MAKEAIDTLEQYQTPEPPAEAPSPIVPSPTGVMLSNGDFTSPNFKSGQVGWRFDALGNFEAVNATFSGTIQAVAINIPDATTANSFHTDSSGNSWWGTSVATGYATAPAYILKDGTAKFNSITAAGYVPQTKGNFGGNGSDGALTITSGTTIISAASAQLLVKNYISVSITGTGGLAFSNPATAGTEIIIKSQGGYTLTSSTAPMIDASGMGAAGGASVSTGSGNIGTAGTTSLVKTNPGGAGDPTNNGGGGGAGMLAGTSGVNGAGGAVPSFILSSLSFASNSSKYAAAFVGAGGGSGGMISGSSPVTGAGGRGGGCLIIECAGAWNFTTASGISVAGLVGGNGGQPSGESGAGGGGGGGFFLGLYNTLTANSGTVTIAGGAAGTGGNKAAGPGGQGFSLIALNTDYA